MFHIAIANEQTTLTINRRAIRRAVSMTLKMEAVADATISIAVVDDATIHRLNREFLKHDFATDVISFLLDGTAGTNDPRAAQQRGAGKTLQGEIVVSADTATHMAESIGWPAHDELTLYIVHGLLHLCGFDDLTKRELPLMRRRERDVLEALGLDLPMRDDDPPAIAAKSPTQRGTKRSDVSLNPQRRLVEADVPVPPRKAVKKVGLKKRGTRRSAGGTS